MNLKKAKAYRQLTRMMINEGSLKGPWAAYRTKSHNKLIMVTEKDENGKDVQVEKMVTVGQVILDPKSPKGMYRRLKREGVERVFASL